MAAASARGVGASCRSAIAAFLFFGARAALDFTDPVTPESPSRFTEGSGNNRAQWWEEAARGFADNPVVGNGAAAFQVNHRRYRESNVEVREPHSLPLQLLSETGLVGFALFAGAVVAAALAVRRDERALLFVLALFGVGVLYDIHWDFTAAGAVVFATLGVLLARGWRDGGRETLWAAGVVALALAGVYSISAPWLADRRIDDAYRAINQGDLALAADKARQARTLNPTSVEPLFALGFVAGRARPVRPRARVLRAGDRGAAGEPRDVVPARLARVRVQAIRGRVRAVQPDVRARSARAARGVGREGALQDQPDGLLVPAVEDREARRGRRGSRLRRARPRRRP